MFFLSIISQKSVKSTFYSASRSSLIFINKGFPDLTAGFCISSNDDVTKNDKKNIKLPEEPQNCCMSGCANCVWVAYAEEVAKILNDGGETAKQKIMEHVKDPNLRAFLLLELSHLFKKKENK